MLLAWWLCAQSWMSFHCSGIMYRLGRDKIKSVLIHMLWGVRLNIMYPSSKAI